MSVKFCEACMKCPKGTFMPTTEAIACTECLGDWVDGRVSVQESTALGIKIILVHLMVGTFSSQTNHWIPQKMTHIFMVHPQMNLPSAWPWGIFGCDFFGGLGFYGIKVGWKSSSPPCWWMVWQGVAWAKWRKRVAHKHKANAAVQKACWCVIQRFDSNGNPPRFLTTCMSNHECFVSVFFRQHVLQSFVLGSASRNPCTREW